MSAKVAAGVDPAKAKKMLSYRWITYGMFLLTYIFVYFDRVAPAVVAPELMKEFGLTATVLGILSSMYFSIPELPRLSTLTEPSTWPASSPPG